MKGLKWLPIFAGIVLAVMLLGGCSTTGAVPVQTVTQIERVPVRAACPDKKTYDGLVADQPVPLRSQPMPSDPDVRVARTAAQLGRYEAKGAWADRARAALDRCQQEGLTLDK